VSKILFVSVGTSALTARELGAANERKNADLRKRAAEFLTHDGSTKRDLEEPLLQELIEAHALHAPKDYGKSPYRTSAEMTSTWLLLQDDPDFPGPFEHATGDKIILLASETREGVLCAQVNAALMRRHFFHCECAAEVCPAVKLEVVKGLEANQKAGAMNTPENIASILRRYNGPTRYFNITGGYKGAIPAISHLCATEFSPCAMFYQHENAKATVRIDLTPRQGSFIEYTERLTPIGRPGR
jgi:putative CRISPR-associated protein (TIGR02619 family)